MMRPQATVRRVGRRPTANPKSEIDQRGVEYDIRAWNAEPGGTMNLRSAIVFALILVVAVITSAQQHAFNVHDLVAMQRIGDPRPSPDGSRVAFVVTTMDLDANKGRRDIWIAATDGSGASRLTTDIANDWSPRWQSDNTLYFMSSRSGSAQVWRWTFDGGVVSQVTDLPLDVGELAVGPRRV